MILKITGKCHTCGAPGIQALAGRVEGVPWCSTRCESRAKFGVGDSVVLDSGYCNGFNGVPFMIIEQKGEAFVGRVLGEWQEFFPWQAAKVGTKRAEAIMNRRKIATFKGVTT